MNVTITDHKNVVKVKFEDGIKFDFSIDMDIDLTDIIKYISEVTSEIIINPSKFEDLKKTDGSQNEETIKLIEYLYKIINSFNESYNEVMNKRPSRRISAR